MELVASGSASGVFDQASSSGECVELHQQQHALRAGAAVGRAWRLLDCAWWTELECVELEAGAGRRARRFTAFAFLPDSVIYIY